MQSTLFSVCSYESFYLGGREGDGKVPKRDLSPTIENMVFGKSISLSYSTHKRILNQDWVLKIFIRNQSTKDKEESQRHYFLS